MAYGLLIYSCGTLKSNGYQNCSERAKLIQKKLKRANFIQTKPSNQHGFTLIEILIVVAIIGLLASISVPYYGQYKQRAYDVYSKANLKSLWLTCNLYWQDNPNGTCNIAAVTNPTYGFSTAVDITLTGQGTKTSFSGTASHKDSPTTFTISSSGNFS